MENLTKHQIILLTLLVSFITSIATGIVTVALMNQAPVGISQTINRVVERTIEQVVATSTPAKSGEPTEKETIVVSEDDQVVSAISNNTKSTVRIYSKDIDPKTGLAVDDFVGLGVVVSNDGTIATDNGVILPGGNYFLKTDAGASLDLSVLEADPAQTVALLKIVNATSSALLPVANLGSADLQLGQTVVYLGGETKDTVATGIVSSLNTKNIIASSTQLSSTTVSATSTDEIISVETSIPQDLLVPGGLLFDLSGDLVGVKAAYAAGSDLFAPISAIQVAIADTQTSTK